MLLRNIPLGTVVALSLALVACSDQPTAPLRSPGSAPHATVTLGRTAIHRLFMAATNDHLYSQDAYEGTAGTPAYTLEHYEYFFIEPDSISGHVALYRCWRGLSSTSGDHWLSTDPDCEGALVIAPDGPQGYIATSQLTGTVPLYRQYNSLLDDTFHTIDPTEASIAANTYNYSSPVVIGYVYTEA